MKASTVARCATANEILRRRRQAVGDNAIHPRTGRQFDLCSSALEHTVLDELPHEKRQRQATSCATPSSFDTSDKACGTEAIVVQMASLEKVNTAIMHRRRSSVWKTLLDRDCTNSAVLGALQLNAERSNLEAPKNLRSKNDSVNAEGDLWGEQFNAHASSHGVLNPRVQDIFTFRFPPLEEPAAFDILSKTCIENLNESASPTSDTTLFDDPVLCFGLLKEVEMLHADTACNGTVRRQSIFAADGQPGMNSTTYLGKRGHRRHVSSNSAFDAIKPPSIPLESRIKTNDGLYSFETKPFRDVNRSFHHHKVSLKLPMKPQSSQLNQADVSNHNMSLRPLSTTIDSAMDVALTPEERDLEYKHGHMFIGTGSLDEFLELLEISSARVTTQSAVARAFLQLASTEQLYARQCSNRPDGWELVSRTTLDVMDVGSIDYVVQLQVKLGAITLRQFMSMIPFDENSEAAATRVVEAFSVASHMDAKANMDKRTKARAFRRWILGQGEELGR